MKNNMIPPVIFSIITLMMSFSVYGQNSVQGVSYEQKTKKVKNKVVKTGSAVTGLSEDKDYILMMDGEAYVRRSGRLVKVESEKLVEGVRVNANGKVVKKDGTVLLLKNGEALDTDEKLVYFDETKMMREVIRMMNGQYTSLSSISRQMEDKMSLLNAKITLLNKKTELMNQKMSLMRKHDHARRMTKAQAQMINDEIRKLEEEMSSLDLLLKELDVQMTKDVSRK